MTRRIRANYVYGTTSASITNTGTTLSSAALARLPAVSSPDIAAITLFDATAGTYEIVWVTAHTAGATTATIIRAQEGSTAAAWANGTTWSHGLTTADAPVLIESNQTGPPAGTPADVMVFRKAGATTLLRGLMIPNLVNALSFDEASGNFANQGSNSANAFTPGTGVVRSKTPLQGSSGAAVAGDGSHNIASLAQASSGLPGAVGTVVIVVKFNSATAKGTLIKFAGSGSNGWSLDVGSGAGNGSSSTLGSNFVIGVNGVTWRNPGATWTTGVHVVALSYDPVGFTTAGVIGQGNLWRLWMDGYIVGGWLGNTPATPSGGGPIVGDDWSGSAEVLSSSVDIDTALWYDRALADDELRVLTNPALSGRAYGWWDGAAMQPVG